MAVTNIDNNEIPDFDGRVECHDDFANRVVRLLKRQGFTVIPWGIEFRMSENDLLKLSTRHDENSAKIRLLPDYLLIGDKGSWFAEVKSPSKRWKNTAIEIVAAEAYAKNPYTFLVVQGMKACWASDIVPKEFYYHPKRGSKHPFFTVDEAETPFLPLYDFLKELK